MVIPEGIESLAIKSLELAAQQRKIALSILSAMDETPEEEGERDLVAEGQSLLRRCEHARCKMSHMPDLAKDIGEWGAAMGLEFQISIPKDSQEKMQVLAECRRHIGAALGAVDGNAD